MCKEKDPCYGCAKRSVTIGHNCHSDCPEYKIYRDDMTDRNEAIRKKKAEEAMMTDVRIRSIERTTKPITTKWKGKKMKIFNAIWQLPQNVVGAIVKIITKATFLTTYKDATVYSWRGKNGVSLGKYIFVPFKKIYPNSPSQRHYIKHEYGHTLQSRYLGWFYIPVILIPSLIWAGCFDGYRMKTGKDYYEFYTESWANKLGGVEE